VSYVVFGFYGPTKGWARALGEASNIIKIKQGRKERKISQGADYGWLEHDNIGILCPRLGAE